MAGYYLSNTVGERASLQMGVPKHTRRRGRKGCVEGWEGERQTEAERSLKPAWARGKSPSVLSAGSLFEKAHGVAAQSFPHRVTGRTKGDAVGNDLKSTTPHGK